MVCIEVVQEVVPNNLTRRALATERVGDELQIFLQCFRTVDHAHEVHEPTADVVVEILVVTDGENIVLVGNERLIFTIVPAAARVGKTFDIK